MSNAPQWFAFYLKARWEKKVADRLIEQGVEVFLPMTKIRRTYSDRKKWVIVPLIPSYLFVRISPSKVFDVLIADGVIKVIRFSGIPAPIPDHQIELLRKAIESNTEVSATTEKFTAGDVVEVITGPLAGMKGVLIALKGKHQVAMQLGHLEYSLLVTIQSRLLRRTGERPEPI
jgi:transcription antitermination factor NusG